jgi:hypothetical protein
VIPHDLMLTLHQVLTLYGHGETVGTSNLTVRQKERRSF